MAAPIDAGSVYSDVRIRLDKLTGDIAGVRTEFNKMNTALEKGSKERTEKQVKNFKQVELAGVAAAAAVTIGFKKAIQTFSTTEQSLANVRAVSKANAVEFAALEKAAEKAGQTTRFTASQAADALFFLSSAGLDATQSVEALDGVLLLAGATGSDLADSAQAVTATLSQFQLQTNESTRVSNVFAAANSNSQATLEKLQNALRQVGPIAGQFGVSLEETTASLQALFNAGLSGEQSGTALRNILLTLADSSSDAAKAFEAAGGSAEDINPRVVGLTTAFENLSTAGVDLSEVFDKRAVGAALILGNTVDKTEGNLRDLEDAVTDTNEAARQYGVQNNTLAGSFDKFKSAAEGTTNALSKELSPTLRVLLDFLSGIFNFVTKLPGTLKAAGAGAIASAIGFTALSKALGLIGITLAGPVGVIAGIGALTVGIIASIARAKELREIKLAEEFSDLAKELGVLTENFDDFAKKADFAASAMQRAASTGFIDAEKQTRELAKNLGLSLDEVIKIGLRASYVSQEYKDQLEILKNQLVEQQVINESLAFQDKFVKAIYERSVERARQDAEAAKAQRERLRQKEQEEANEKRLVELKNQLRRLDELAKAGALEEKDILEEKISIRQEELNILLDQSLESKELSTAQIQAIKDQRAEIDRYKDRVEALEKAEKEKGETETETAEKAIDYAKQIIGINKLQEAGIIDNKEAIKRKIEVLKEEISAIQKQATEEGSLSKEQIARIQGATEELEKYQDQIKETGKETKGLSDETKKAFTDAQNTIKNIFDSLDTIINTTSENWDESLSALGSTITEVGIKSGNAYVAAAGVVLQAIGEIAGAIRGIIELEEERERLVKDINDRITEESLAQTRDRISRTRELELEAIESREEAELKQFLDTLSAKEKAALKTAGVIEETEKERIQRQLNEAIYAGDEEEKSRLQNELSIAKIRENSNKERQEAEANYQNALAQYEYDKAVFDRDARASQAEADKQSALAGLAWWQWVAGVDKVVSSTYDKLINKINSVNIPTPPSFQTGGIVLPGSSGGGRLVEVAENRSPELMFNGGDEGRAFMQEFAGMVAGMVSGSGGQNRTIVVELNGRVLAQAVETEAQNGNTRIVVR